LLCLASKRPGIKQIIGSIYIEELSYGHAAACDMDTHVSPKPKAESLERVRGILEPLDFAVPSFLLRTIAWRTSLPSPRYGNHFFTDLYSIEPVVPCF